MTDANVRQEGRLKRLCTRLVDRGRWPRSWWYPLPPRRKFDPATLPELHKECSQTIRRAMMATLGFALFCLLTALGARDELLIGAQAEINIPFADVPISFIGFIGVAPLLLIILSIYLHVFVGHLREIEAAMAEAGTVASVGRVPTIFNLEAAVPRWLTAFIFYWLVPLVLAAITWKAMGTPKYGVAMASLTQLVAFALLFLQIRRSPEGNRRWPNRIRWLALALIVAATGLIDDDFRRPLNLFRADLRDAYLVFADLRDADLRRATLEGANLSGADLSNANLMHANCSKIRLIKANLSGAVLSEANFSGADLLGANLHRADLTKADFTEANLSVTNLIGVFLRGSVLESADLEWARFWPRNLEGEELSAAKQNACKQIMLTKGWVAAYRNLDMACGEPIPNPLR